MEVMTFIGCSADRNMNCEIFTHYKVKLRLYKLFLLFITFFFLLGLSSCSKKEDVLETYTRVQTEIDPFFRKEGLKILDIGNSYSDDATALLPLLVKTAKVDLHGMSLYKAIRGGLLLNPGAMFMIIKI